jgi:gluconokinase
MNRTPKSGREMTDGMVYFARMLDKIRLHARGELRPDYHANLGHGADGWCVGFLRVPYPELTRRVLEGGTDEEILQWCYEHGRRLDDNDLYIWNMFATKLGWNDRATPRLEKYKAESGLAGRTDILTIFDYFDVDEGRKP